MIHLHTTSRTRRTGPAFIFTPAAPPLRQVRRRPRRGGGGRSGQRRAGQLPPGGPSVPRRIRLSGPGQRRCRRRQRGRRRGRRGR
eukprot:3878218-Rhodomonas_salina.1